MTHTKCHHKT